MILGTGYGQQPSCSFKLSRKINEIQSVTITQSARHETILYGLKNAPINHLYCTAAVASDIDWKILH